MLLTGFAGFRLCSLLRSFRLGDKFGCLLFGLLGCSFFLQSSLLQLLYLFRLCAVQFLLVLKFFPLPLEFLVFGLRFGLHLFSARNTLGSKLPHLCIVRFRLRGNSLQLLISRLCLSY